MEIRETTVWDEAFFEEFLHFKESIQKDLPTFFPETLEDYKKYLHPDSLFAKDYSWIAFLVLRDDKVVAKAILAWRHNLSYGNLGFLDWINDKDVASALVQRVEDRARERGLKQIKTPIDLNFFVKYRIKLPGGGEPFYGEPIYPDYYHELFKHVGYEVIGRWDTYRVKKWGTIVSYSKKRKLIKERRHPHNSDLKVRYVQIKKWDQEIKTIYDLFHKSYGQMPEFEPITFEQFKLIYDDFKYIIHPWYSYVVELDGRPVGFSINYFDPLKILSSVKGKGLSLLSKFFLLARLRANFRTLLMAYVGKVPGPNGEDIKGVQIKVSRKLSRNGFFVGKALVCYQSDDSPSRRPFDSDTLKEYSQYVLYGKALN